jgi:hypothetical protein
MISIIAPFTMSEFIKILQDESQSLIDKIRQNMASTDTNATGKTSESLEYQIIEEGDRTTINILANAFAQVIETGRKPTPEKEPSYSMIENLREWAEARGLSSLVWGIAKEINKNGTKLWQKGGRNDIYTLPFNEFVDILTNKILDMEIDNFFIKTINSYNGKKTTKGFF